VLTGRKLIRGISGRLLREWAVDVTGLPPWLLAECYDSVGDLSETLALLLPHHGRSTDEPLHHVVTHRILPLAHMDQDQQRELVLDTWRTFDAPQRFVFHKLISGTFRFGAAAKLVINAMAQAADVEPAVMQHRMAGRYTPSVENYLALLRPDDGEVDAARPYPFYLAHQLDDPPAEALGDIADWQAEWKWDGIRAQLLRRGDTVLLWSRGDELIDQTFPEIADAGRCLPDGTALDGEVLAFEAGAPLPFSALQRRLNRKAVAPALFADVPVVFMVYDLLESGGADLRGLPTAERRERLEAMDVAGCSEVLRVSPVVEADTWDQLAELRGQSRERGVEGLMLKRRDSVYKAGRVRGDWWKWKIDPYTVDCVMIYAQRGTGRRSTLFTDYTFGVWTGEPPGDGELVPVCKAYSGLTDAEIAKVDRWVTRHTTGRSGPVRFVEPGLVFEIAFEAIAASDRHKSGIALRFPRMARWRQDKKPVDADTLGNLQRLLAATQRRAITAGT
jgi:DNA ligase-1